MIQYGTKRFESVLWRTVFRTVLQSTVQQRTAMHSPGFDTQRPAMQIEKRSTTQQLAQDFLLWPPGEKTKQWLVSFAV